MSNPDSIWNHPIEKLEEALSIRKQIAALQAKLGSLFGGGGEVSTSTSTSPKTKKARGGKRTMSPEARERIAAAQRARWAKVKGTSAPAAAKPAATKKKRTLSPEARAKIAEAARRRWAKVKKG